MAINNLSGEDVATITWYNGTGSAVASGDMVELGTDPDCYVAVAAEDIAAAATGTLYVKGRFQYAVASGNGGGYGAPYYKSSATLLTLTGNSTIAFCGFGCSSIIAQVTGNSYVALSLAGGVGRPNFES